MEFSDLGEKKQDVTHGDAADYVNTRISTGSVNRAMDLNATKSQTTEDNYEQLRLESKRSDDKNVNKKNDRDTMQWKDQPKEIKCIIYTLSVMIVILYIILTTVVVVMILPKDEPDGSWTQWSAWSNCDATCDNGIQTRLRLCNNPSTSTEELDCKGNSTDARQCQKNPCPADGSWTQWSAWSNCDVTCDNGIQTRLRLCNNPSTSTEELDCKGNSTDSRQCQKNHCPVPGVYVKKYRIYKNVYLSTDYGVAFTVYNPNTTGDSYTVLKFRSSFLNKGDGYNSTTGVFTCRVPGVYHFAITLTKRYGDISITRAYMRINGFTNIHLYYYPKNDDSNEVGTYIMTGAGTYHLNINDTAFVYGVPNFFQVSTYSSFTGFLVSPDV